MDKQPARLNITRQFLEKAKSKLEVILHFAEPDEQFRFFTFEGNDYLNHKLTLLLFSFVPKSVYVSVPHGCNLEKAVEEVKQLNPQLTFQKVELNYVDPADEANKRQTQELRVIYTPMLVDQQGKLVV